MNGTCGGLGELRIGDRFRHDGVHRAADRVVMKADHDHGGQVVDLDARHPLTARTKSTSQPHAEEGLDQLHGSAVASQDKADPQTHDTHTQGLGLDRLRFPGLRHVGEKTASRPGILIHDPISGVSVDPNGRGAHKNTWFHGGGGDPFDQTPRPLNAALENAAALLTGPDAEDRFPGEVNEDVAAGDIHR